MAIKKIKNQFFFSSPSPTQDLNQIKPGNGINMTGLFRSLTAHHYWCRCEGFIYSDSAVLQHSTSCYIQILNQCIFKSRLFHQILFSGLRKMFWYQGNWRVCLKLVLCQDAFQRCWPGWQCTLFPWNQVLKLAYYRNKLVAYSFLLDFLWSLVPDNVSA